MTSTNALTVERLTVAAGSLRILRGLGFSLFPGELCGLIGPSGAGKSTLIKALLGLRAPDEGRVELDGSAVTAGGAVGYVPQDDALHRTLTVRRALDYAARLRRPELDADARAKLIGTTAKRLDLSERLDVRIRRLSGGQRKRVCVALELMTEPGLLILDEPTSGLDPHLESRLMALFAEIAGAGRIVMVATHAMQSLDRCHALLILVEGSIAYFGPPASAPEHFQADDFAGIFTKLTERKGEAWARIYASSTVRRAFAERAESAKPPPDAALARDGRVVFERLRAVTAKDVANEQ